jgi:hypothetical protein
MQMKMNIVYWWNDTDRGEPKYREKNLSQCHFAQHKPHSAIEAQSQSK